eukprot:scaffold674328_cov53-Prasinocladus_malaysianus.AAC.1
MLSLRNWAHPPDKSHPLVGHHGRGRPVHDLPWPLGVHAPLGRLSDRTFHHGHHDQGQSPLGQLQGPHGQM